MSDNNKSQSAAPGASGNPDPTPTPTLTHHQQVAAQFIAAFNTAMTLLGEMEVPRPATVRFVHAHQSVPEKFVTTTVGAVEAASELQGVNNFGVDETRDSQQKEEAYRPLVRVLLAAGQGVKFTLDFGKAKRVASSLQLYDIAKGVARDPNSASVVAHVANMRRDLGRTRPKRRVKVPVQVPVQVPAEVPAAESPSTVKKPS